MRASPPPVVVLALACALLTCLVAGAARAEWSPQGVTVKNTTNAIPLVEACADGAGGTFVAWQEEVSPGQGELRVHHLLPTGDLDPFFPPAGAVANGTLAARQKLGVLPDRLGGVYVWWKEGTALRATRIDAGGQVAAGWPAQGRALGVVQALSPDPSVIEDGANGFYAAWTSASALPDDPIVVVGVHLGPGNVGAGGWPNGLRVLVPSDPVLTIEYWPQLALAPDGGIFLAWATASTDSAAVPSVWRLRRFTSAGLNASGWPASGYSFGSIAWERYGSDVTVPLLGISPDGRGGVFLLVVNVMEYSNFEPRLFRRMGDGQSAVDWPDAGRVVPGGPFLYYGFDADEPVRVMPDGLDGAIVGIYSGYSHMSHYGYRRGTSSGQFPFSTYIEGTLKGHEAFPKGDGGVFMAHFVPNGPYGPYQSIAYLSVDQSVAPASWRGWGESHPENVVQWYGDIGLAPAGDGGAVFYWSQVRERFGLFARHFSRFGQVIGIEPPGGSALALRGLRYVPGVGLRAWISAPVGPARFDAFDVSGRRVATTTVAAGPVAVEVTLPGTVQLRSGLYFGRLTATGDVLTARAVVTR